MGLGKRLIVLYAVCAAIDFGTSVDFSSYTQPSAHVGLLLQKYDPNDAVQYPFEYGFGYYYEGDILLPPGKNAVGRVGLKDDIFLMEYWPGGRIPYVVSDGFTPAELDILKQAFAQYHDNTCVRFVPRTPSDEIYLTIANNDYGCYSYVGRSGINDYNHINLQTPGCMYDVGTPTHELMHAIGFFHEFTRPDRDRYVTINVTNLRPEYQNEEFLVANFGKLPKQYVTSYNVPYSYDSVMHYSRFAGAASRCCAVLMNIKPWFGDFGNDNGLSHNDIRQINAKYCS